MDTNIKRCSCIPADDKLHGEMWACMDCGGLRSKPWYTELFGYAFDLLMVISIVVLVSALTANMKP
jgi:hypothetical protein